MDLVVNPNVLLCPSYTVANDASRAVKLFQLFFALRFDFNSQRLCFCHRYSYTLTLELIISLHLSRSIAFVD